MAETASEEAAQNVARGTLDATLSYKLPNGGEIVIHISTDNIHVEEVLRKLAGYVVGAGVITLGGLLGYKMLKPFVESAVRKALGEVDKITPGSLRVVIHCLTVERFLKIVEDHESGRIKQCLQDELLQFRIEVEGLKVEIENIEVVNKTKEEINKKRKQTMMTEREEKTRKKSDSRAAAGDDEWKFSTSEKSSFDMAETASAEAAQNVAKGTLDARLEYAVLPNRGNIATHISTDNIHVAEKLCKLAGYVVVGAGVITLGGLLGYEMLKPFVESAVRHVFGEVDILPGSLRVVIHCLTDERFLKIVEDHESGRIKQCLQDELLQFGIEVEGLKVEIENIEEVNKTKEEINKKRKAETMTEGEEKTTKESDSPAAAAAAAGDDGRELSTGDKEDFPEKYRNWLAVGELISLIQNPIATYVDSVIKHFHKNLCDDLRSVCNCKTRGTTEIKIDNLCISCKSWLKKLKEFHRAGNNPTWYRNCNSARWSEDHWEVAKFFMPALGSNHNSKHAKSTDLPSLLSVLEWMKDEAFPGKTRVKIELAKKLRSQVRNTWAHAPKQEFDNSEKSQSFSIATEFLDDLEVKFPSIDNRDCHKHFEKLQNEGVTNVFESELQSLVSQRDLLDEMEEEITKLRVEHSNAIRENKQKLDELQEKFNKWSKQSSERRDENIHIKQLVYFRSATFTGITDVLNQLRDQTPKINQREIKEQEELTSDLPNVEPEFTARVSEIEDVIALLTDERKAVVSLHGGPGFGKTTIAIEVSHKLKIYYNITVIFSRLTMATTVDEMVRKLCLKVGVHCEYNNPKPSLVLWLKNVHYRVAFVLDDVDNLLEENKLSNFDNFIQLLGKNQNCQIITTSRSSYSISTLSFGMVDVKEMDSEACIELLKRLCCVEDEISLQKMAELCGYIPLAMCVAAPQIDTPEEFPEFCDHLENKPFHILDDHKSNRYVYRIINMSYERLDEEKKGILVCLAVFDGSFRDEAASVVIGKNKFVTKQILKDFVCRSLIKQTIKHRYSIHLLIQHFLKNGLKSEKREAERARAEVLMIKHYLELGHDLSIKTYSKNGYKPNRVALKNEAHHIQKVLNICCKQDVSSDILDCLAESEIYNNSAKFFALLARTIIPRNIIQNFLERCAQLAEEREQQAIKINFDCLLAGQARRETVGRSDEDYESKMEKLQEQFEANEDLKQDKPLYAHYLYHQGRYLTHQAENLEDEARLERQIQGREKMEKSLKLRNMLDNAPEGIADKAFTLLHVGNACKIIAITESFLKKMAQSKLSSEQAQEHYEEAKQLCEDKLGDHELTAACYKSLGDLFLRINDPEKAKENYTKAKEMREKLGLDASKRHVSLLNKLGISLTKLKQASEAIELLENARMMAEELADSDEPTVCKSKVYASLASAYNAKQKYSEDAVTYAKKAMEFDGIEKSLGKYYKEIREIANSEMMDTTD